MTMDFKRWASSLTAFAEWIGVEDYQAGLKWSSRLGSGNDESAGSAVAEAVAWDYISSRSDSVRLNDKLGIGGVDFEFSVDGYTYLVEVTNISTEAASTASGMPDEERSSGYYGLLTKNIRQKVRGKLRQARCQSQYPLLVFVTTLHRNASCSCINHGAVEFAMGSPSRITGEFNPSTGEVEGDLYESTDLAQSVFLTNRLLYEPDGLPIAQAKYQPISGFLLGGFGLSGKDVSVLGALNPEATRPFNPDALPDIPFCSFQTWPAKEMLAFSWNVSEE